MAAGAGACWGRGWAGRGWDMFVNIPARKC
ncbi:hypothetical protein E2C01_084471 [Portunus trituberculatus]|uniref:Uncharacterized protein n=1 Tax=Portunus trituberculatus TaxID=210409 RepID=A0A5B7IYC8_PORTR|nr:hypothetical protein [Portunus trituberculatus]